MRLGFRDTRKNIAETEALILQPVTAVEPGLSAAEQPNFMSQTHIDGPTLDLQVSRTSALFSMGTP